MIFLTLVNTKYAQYFALTLVNLIAGIVPLNSSNLIIEFSDGDSKLSEILKKGFDFPIVQIYYQLLVKVAVLFGANKKRAEKEMKAVVKLEIKLANFTLPAEQKRNLTATYHPMPLSEVQKLYPEVPLVQYIKAITGVEVTEEEVVNVESPSFITKEISIIQYSFNVPFI